MTFSSAKRKTSYLELSVESVHDTRYRYTFCKLITSLCETNYPSKIQGRAARFVILFQQNCYITLPSYAVKHFKLLLMRDVQGAAYEDCGSTTWVPIRQVNALLYWAAHSRGRSYTVVRLMVIAIKSGVTPILARQ